MIRNTSDKRERVMILAKDEIRRSLVRIAHEVIESNRGKRDMVLLGVSGTGERIASHIAADINLSDGWLPPSGSIEPRLYRDDPAQASSKPVQPASAPCDVSGRCVVLVDDVIQTGRTVRAAIEAVFALGRPSQIQLAVLIDIGHRELPLRPDYVGKNLPTSRTERVEVIFDEPKPNSEDGVILVR